MNLLSGHGQTAASLVVLNGAAIGRMFRLGPHTVVIGRGSDATIQIDDEGISRAHVKLLRTDTGVELEDMGSKNGTLLNGEPVTHRTPLKNGDKFQIGNTVFRFTVLDELDDQAQQQLYAAAVHDGLTGIFNRRFLDELLPKEFAFAERHDVPLSLLMIDVDHFKRVNDTYGHIAGDVALTAIARCLASGLRTEDVVARYGGEEFVLILRELTEDVAVAVANRLRLSVEALGLVAGNQSFNVTVSVGIATHIKGMFKSAEELLATADKYALRAKASGRNRVCSRWLP